MKKYFTNYFIISILAFSLLLHSSCNNPQSKVPDKKTVDGKYKLGTANISMTIDANFGGRIISLKLDSSEFLTGPGIHPENYGSTFWTSPQKDWGWPPAPALDIEPYNVISYDSMLYIRSKADEKSGYQLSKQFIVSKSDTSFLLTYILKNVSSQVKNVAGWEITRVLAGGLSFFAKESEKAMKSEVNTIDTLDHIWFDYDSAKISSHQKLFWNGKGWLAHVNNKGLFIKQFPDIQPNQAAPVEEEVEIYVNDKKDYVELENQGEYTKLAPGDSLTWKVKWYLRRMPENINKTKPNGELINCVNKLIGM